MKNIIVISAPSGAGKTTLCGELQRRKPHIKFSVSCTTRPKRENEVDGVNYHFLSDQEFTEKVQNNEFVEFENVHGYYYGTLRKTLEDALERPVTLPEALEQVSGKEVLSINMPPDFALLREFLLGE